MLSTISMDKLENLSQKKIYFGHQSVGFNIVDGIKDIMTSDSRIKLNLREIPDVSVLPTEAGFYHGRIGKNNYPELKMSDFEKSMDGKVSSSDIAFFKLCYVDIRKDTDVNDLFKKYKEKMAGIRFRHPRTTYVHFTVPLTTGKPTIKARIKKILGRGDVEYLDNIKKNEFNALMRKEYEGKEPIFDLARIEATYQDGRRASFMERENNYDVLVPEYSDDGGHLNNIGRRAVAEQLIVFLANLSEK